MTPAFARQLIPLRLAGALSVALAALAASGCGGDLTPPVLPVAVDPLQVAAAADPDARTYVVDAREPRTHIGHFQAGQRVQISVLGARWNDAPGPDLFDAHGSRARRCVSTLSRTCIGNGAPFMGLVLITVTDDAAAQMAESPWCEAETRLHIPTGAEFAVPFDAELLLGPNDWEDGVDNNDGLLLVELERAAAKDQPAFQRRQLKIGARTAHTFAGHFHRGEYVRITVKGGGWNHHPGAPLVGAAGDPTQKCGAVGHRCVGGDGLPLMGLVLLLSECSERAVHQQQSRAERVHIPDGAEVLLENDASLYLAPNDFEDAFTDNSGSARVQVKVLGK